MEGKIPQVVLNLVAMDIDQELAALAYKNNPGCEDMDTLMNWILAEQDRRENSQTQSTNIEKKEGEKIEPEGETQPISGFIDQELAKTLQEMGFSKNVSEKSLFFTQDKKTVEAAMEWIEQHKTDADYEEELRVVGQKETVKLSPEEAKELANKMLKDLRDKKKKDEEEQEKIREINRIKNGKMMAEAKRIFDEQEMIRQLNLRKKEKEEEAREKQRMEEQLRKDKIERFGNKAAFQSAQTKEATQVILSPIAKFEVSIKQIVIANDPQLIDDKAKNCLNLIKAYIANILNNPGQEKFRKIKRENNAFKNKVEDCFGGVDALNTAGFKDDGAGYLVLSDLDEKFLNDCLRVIDNVSVKMFPQF